MAEKLDTTTADLDPAPPLKTVAVFHLAARTGAGLSLVHFLSWLSETGSVEMIVPRAGEPSQDLTSLGPVTPIDYASLTLPEGPRALVRLLRRFIRDVRRFRRLIREREPDVILIATSTIPAALLAARLERIPTVVYVAELFEDRSANGRHRRIPAALVLGFTQRLANSLICCSHAVAAQFKTRGRMSPRIAFPAIDGRFSEGNADHFRSRHELEAVKPLIGVVGNISRGRGQDVVIRAMRTVRAHLPSATCVFVGEPHPRRIDLEYRDELILLSRQLGVSDCVRFVGFCDRIADLYSAVDLVVNPARFEAFGRVACEALVAGRPVVCTRTGGIPEVLRDGIDALLVRRDDPDALAQAIVRIAQDEQLGARMARSGRQRVLTRYTSKAELNQFRLALDAALSNRHHSASRPQTSDFALPGSY